MKRPLVSVVMTAYNAEKYISRAIESILNQKLKNFEFIVINDASSDRSEAIIKSYKKRDKRIRLINNPHNLKVARSLNRGVSAAKSNLIARMDADDIAQPQRLKIQYNFMKNHPKIAVVGTNISIIDENEKVISKREYPTRSNDLKKIMLRYSPFAHPTVMFRKDIFNEFGGYNTKVSWCEDIDLWFRVGTKYDFANIPKKLLKYTIANTSVTSNNQQSQELVGFRVKINAIRKYGYIPSLYDIIYNLLQFLTMWLMPPNPRIKLYNALRSRELI